MSAGAPVSVSVRRSYTALVGDLLVVFTDDSSLDNADWYVDVVDARDASRVLTSVDIPRGYSDGQLIIGCGVIDVPGPLVVRLLESSTSDVLAQSNVVDVAWPSVTLRLPASHSALVDDVPITLTVDHRVCQSQQPHASYTLQLVYLGVNVSSVVYEQTLTTLVSSSPQLVVPCSLVDRAGSYHAVLTSSRRSDVPLAVSDVMAVTWSQRYSLSLTPARACRGGEPHAVARLTLPRCAGVVYTLRLFVRTDGAGGSDVTMVRSRDWRYVSERRVESSRTSVTLDCALLARYGALSRDELCALLVSIASDGSQHVQRRYCTRSTAVTFHRPRPPPTGTHSSPPSPVRRLSDC